MKLAFFFWSWHKLPLLSSISSFYFETLSLTAFQTKTVYSKIQVTAKWYVIRKVHNGCHLVHQVNTVPTPYPGQLSSLHSPPQAGKPCRRDGVFSSLSFCGLTCASEHEQQMFYFDYLNSSQDLSFLGPLRYSSSFFLGLSG